MNIIITNICLFSYTGTEVSVRDLAFALHRRGINVEVYSPLLGVIANEIREAGINVVDSVEDFTIKPDLIHAKHFIPTMEVILKFPDVPIIYFSHDRTHLNDIPPRYPRILKYVAVDNFCLERLIVDNGIPKERTEVLFNWVDTTRFQIRKRTNKKPTKALIFSNYATKENFYTEISKACSMAGISLDVVGSRFNNSLKDPETILHNYDIIFAKAKAAIEAIATGAAVILCDYRGLGEMVNSNNFDYLRSYNFGMKTLNKPIDANLILNEISKYDSEESYKTSLKIRECASFEKYQDRIIHLYEDTIKNDKHEPVDQDRLYGNVAEEYKTLKYQLFETKIDILKAQNIELKNNIQEIKKSWSFRLGRIITLPLRLLFDCISLFIRSKSS